VDEGCEDVAGSMDGTVAIGGEERGRVDDGGDDGSVSMIGHNPRRDDVGGMAVGESEMMGKDAVGPGSVGDPTVGGDVGTQWPVMVVEANEDVGSSLMGKNTSVGNGRSRMRRAETCGGDEPGGDDGPMWTSRSDSIVTGMEKVGKVRDMVGPDGVSVFTRLWLGRRQWTWRLNSES
jgi:hypothetical protein